MFKVLFLCTVLALCHMPAAHPLLHVKKAIAASVIKWPLAKIHGLANFVALKTTQPLIHPVVYAAPAPVHVEEPLLNTADLLSLWDAIKLRAYYANPLVKLFAAKKTLPVPVIVPQYKLVPTLGFTHYNKINYAPVIPVHQPEHFETIYEVPPAQPPTVYGAPPTVYQPYPVPPPDTYGPPQPHHVEPIAPLLVEQKPYA